MEDDSSCPEKAPHLPDRKRCIVFHMFTDGAYSIPEF